MAVTQGKGWNEYQETVIMHAGMDGFYICIGDHAVCTAKLWLAFLFVCLE